MTAWTEAERRVRRADYDRHHRSGHAAHESGRHARIPADIIVLDRDPYPCVRCGEREGCRHRTAFGWGR
jgi:hypothetical protein